MRVRIALVVAASPLVFVALALYMVASMIALPIVLLSYDFVTSGAPDQPSSSPDGVS